MRTPILGLLVACIPATASADVDRYQGICDGSAAVALGPEHFIVANDDEDILQIYRLGEAAPVGHVDVIDFLGNRKPNGKDEEADIEGAARIGDRIYWISSHGRDKDGHFKKTRLRFFATDVVQHSPVPAVTPVGTPYKKLLDDLINEPKLQSLGLAAASQIAPEEEEGFNIEGLAAMPDGRLLIGFRNPRPGNAKQAILIPLENPAGLIEGEKAKFGSAIRLDLGHRGVRSIERIGDRYIIVAGSHDSAPNPGFAIFTWSGNENDPPAQVTGVDLQGLGPEALFALDEPGSVYILSDDGDEPAPDGEICKHAANKSFRGLRLKLE